MNRASELMPRPPRPPAPDPAQTSPSALSRTLVFAAVVCFIIAALATRPAQWAFGGIAAYLLSCAV
jgi:hypothetical protein